jgi:hypothetical protein
MEMLDAGATVRASLCIGRTSHVARNLKPIIKNIVIIRLRRLATAEPGAWEFAT